MYDYEAKLWRNNVKSNKYCLKNVKHAFFNFYPLIIPENHRIF